MRGERVRKLVIRYLGEGVFGLGEKRSVSLKPEGRKTENPKKKKLPKKKKKKKKKNTLGQEETKKNENKKNQTK